MKLNSGKEKKNNNKISVNGTKHNPAEAEGYVDEFLSNYLNRFSISKKFVFTGSDTEE